MPHDSPLCVRLLFPNKSQFSGAQRHSKTNTTQVGVCFLSVSPHYHPVDNGGKKSHTQSQTLTLGGGFSWGSAIKISPGFTYKTPSTFFTNLLCMTVVSSIITYQPTATEQWEAIFGKVREIINQWCITGMQCFPHTDWTAHSNALTAAKDIWWLVLASYFQSLIAANNLSQHLPVSLSLTDISLASPQLPLPNDYWATPEVCLLIHKNIQVFSQFVMKKTVPLIPCNHWLFYEKEGNLCTEWLSVL